LKFRKSHKQSQVKRPQLKVGLGWYRAEQWQRLREISADVEILEEVYADWLELAEQQIRELSATGLDVEKVDVDVNALLLWCNAQGLPVNAQSRARYVSEALQKRSKGK
jgi:hypothetical protein